MVRDVAQVINGYHSLVTAGRRTVMPTTHGAHLEAFWTKRLASERHLRIGT